MAQKAMSECGEQPDLAETATDWLPPCAIHGLFRVPVK